MNIKKLLCKYYYLIILKLFLCFSFKFIDFDLSDDDTCKATIRMFLQCNLVQQFQIPYHVRIM